MDIVTSFRIFWKFPETTWRHWRPARRLMPPELNTGFVYAPSGG